MNPALKSFANRVKKLVAAHAEPRRSRRPQLSIECLEDRVVPSITTLASPNGRWTASVEGTAHVIESVRVTEASTGRLVYQSGAFQHVMDGTLTWSPNSLELAWVQKNSGNLYSYDWAGVLPTPTVVPSYSTPPSAPIFSADSSLLRFNRPGNAGFVSFSVPTTPPGVRITGMPSTVTAGTPFQVHISASVNDFNGLAYVGPMNLTSSDGQQVLGTSTINVKGSGVATIQLNKAGNIAIRGTENNGFWGSSQVFTVSPANATSFVVSAPGTATVGTPFNVTITARDQFGNVATGYSGTANLGSNSQGFAPTAVKFTNGFAKVSVTFKAAGGYYLQATDAFVSGTSSTITVGKAKSVTTLVSSAATSVCGQAVTFTATVSAVAPASGIPNGYVTFVVDGGTPVKVQMTLGQAKLTMPSLSVGKHMVTASFFANPDFENSTATITQTVNLAITQSVPGAIAGSSYSSAIQASGGSGNYRYSLAPNNVLPAGLTLSSAGVLSGMMTIAGKYTFTVKATDLSRPGVNASRTYILTVSPAALSALALKIPAAAKAGIGFYATVTARDRFGNAYNGRVSLSCTDAKAVLPASVTLVNGTARVFVVLKTAGTRWLKASMGTLIGSANISVSPAAASRFAVSSPTAATAGEAFQVTLIAKDPFGNDVPSFNGVVRLYSTDGQAVRPATVTLVNGKATANVTLTLAHTVKLAASNGVIGGYSGLITVSPAAVAKVTVKSAAVVGAGNRLNVVITGKDIYGNNCNGSVKLTSSDGQPVSPDTFTMTNGVAYASVYLYKAGVVQLTAAIGKVSGTGGNVTVVPAAVASFAVGVPSTATVGAGFSVTITALDRYGNTVTGFTGTVLLTSSDGQTVSPTHITLVRGKVTTNITLKKSGIITLTAALGVLKGTSDAFTVV
ncbi:MAG: Ig-like domain repeat protein [Planctomycetes bacterium]|nr:Ig-like domain repeat protein [Planctomycetota bacterium]